VILYFENHCFKVIPRENAATLLTSSGKIIVGEEAPPGLRIVRTWNKYLSKITWSLLVVLTYVSVQV
jgi:hypothetical protein